MRLKTGNLEYGGQEITPTVALKIKGELTFEGKVNHEIKKADFSQLKNSKVSMSQLKPLLLKYKTIESLDLSDNELSDEDVDFICELLENNTKLKELTIKYHKFINEASSRKIEMALKKNFTLQKLNAEAYYSYGNPKVVSSLGELMLARNADLSTIDDKQNEFKSKNAVWDSAGFEQMSTRFLSNQKLETVSFRGCRIDLKALAKFINDKPSVTKLYMTNCKFTSADAITLENLMVTRLAWIQFYRCGLMVQDVNFLLKVAGKSTSLISINLSENNIDETSIPLIATLANAQSRIKYISLKEMYLPEGYQTEFNIGSIIQELIPNLSIVNFDLTFLERNNVSYDANVKQTIQLCLQRNHLFRAFLKNPWILVSQNQKYSSVLLKPIFDRLIEFSSLCCLDLAKSHLDDEGIKILCNSLKTKSSVTSLSLEATDMKDDGAIQLAEVLRSKTPLAILNVSNNAITRSGFVAIAQELKDNTTLFSLNASCNPIPGDAISRLGECLVKNKYLTTLRLSYTNIDEASYAAFLKKIDPTQDTSINKRERKDMPRNYSLTQMVVSQDGGLEYVKSKYASVRKEISYSSKIKKTASTFLEVNQNKMNELISAVEQGNLEVVKNAIKISSIYICTSDGDSLLHLAVAKRHLDIAKFLLGLNFNRLLINNKDLNPLELAKSLKNEDMIKLLSEEKIVSGQKLKRKIEESEKESDKSRASSGSSSTVKKARADQPKESKDSSTMDLKEDGDTNGNSKIIKKEDEASIPESIIPQSSIVPPLAQPIQVGFSSPSVDSMEKFFDLVASSQYFQLRGFIQSHPQLINQLHTGISALHVAAQIGQCESAQILLEFKAEKDKLNHVGFTPLYTLIHHFNDTVANAAVSKQKLDLAYLLIRAGSKTNIPVEDKQIQRSQFTALHKAVTCGNYRLMKIVLQGHDCDPNEKDSEGLTALDLAAQRLDLQMLARLLIDRRLTTETLNTLDKTLKSIKDVFAEQSIKKALEMVEKRKSASVPDASPGMHWTANLSLFYGSRFGKSEKTLVLAQEEEHAFLLLQNKFSSDRLFKGPEGSKDEKKEVNGNPVTASLIFIVSAKAYKPGNNPKRLGIKIRLAFDDHHHVSLKRSDKEQVEAVIHRAKSAPSTIFEEKYQHHKTAPKNADEISDIFKNWLDSQDPNYNLAFHHGETSLLDYLESPENINQILLALSQRPELTKGAKIYGVILNIHSPRYLCENCEIAILGEQNPAQSKFLQTLACRAKELGYVIPSYSPLRMLTLASSYLEYNHDPVTDKEHKKFEIDMRTCHTDLILIKDQSSFDPSLTTFHSSMAGL